MSYTEVIRRLNERIADLNMKVIKLQIRLEKIIQIKEKECPQTQGGKTG